MESLALHGVDAIFGNPGTTENPLLDRLIDYPDIRYFVALHESVAVCAASFYAQATGKTAVANLHVAPGLGNGIGMMYGALKAQSPLIVTAGQQDTRMRLNEPLLSHDLVAMAAPVVKWSAEPRSADEIGPIMRRAFKVANEAPAGPVFVALPVDVMEQETQVLATSRGSIAAPVASQRSIQDAAALIAGSVRPAIIIGDEPTRAGAFDEVVRLAETLGAPVFHEGLHAQVSFPNHHPSYRGRVPFEAAATARLLEGHDLLLLLGGPFFEAVWFDDASPFPEAARVIQLDSDGSRIGRNFPVDVGLIGDNQHSLNALNAAIEAGDADWRRAASARNDTLASERQQIETASKQQLEKLWDVSPMSPARALHELSQTLPAETIIVDESITTSLEVGGRIEYSRPGDYYGARGGGIGQGIAGALGIQIAHPDRRVLAISGDGSAMYSVQTFWSAAHHDLPIVFVILANREYRVLKHNLDIYRKRFDIGSNKPYPHMDLNNPELDFPGMAQGMGVAGELVEDPAEVGPAIARAFAADAPRVVEIVISRKP
jgi:benzoylformate decarboxylase